MKRIVSLLLSLVLFWGFFAVASQAEEAEVTARPTPAAVVVNNEAREFEAYNIGGNNYFKLRDIAFALNNTDKNFNVVWNEEEASIRLISETPYTPVGGEMEKREQETVSVKSTVSPIFLDGERISLTAYNIRGNNFFKLRDILELFDIGVSWDPHSSTIYVDSLVQKEVTVSTSEEFEKAIASNTIINVKPGTYDLTAFNNDETYGFEIFDVYNLTIIGAGEDKTEFINADRFKAILIFKYCRGISVSGIKAGHTPQEYECDAGVLEFRNCLDVEVGDCYLYGCGSMGMDISYSTNVSVNNTTITDCSFLAVYVSNSANVVFNDCRIMENSCYGGAVSVYSLDRDTDIEFNKCDITGNYNLGEGGMYTGLIQIVTGPDAGETPLTFNDCNISGNSQADGGFTYLFDIRTGLVTLNRCTIKNNKIVSEYYCDLPRYVDCEISGNDFNTN